MTTESSEKITKKAKSNLAFAFMGLSPEIKKNLTQFYAFCRIVDDIADEIGPSPESKTIQMDHWRNIIHEKVAPSTPLEHDVVELVHNPVVETEAMLTIIDGCASDISPQRFATLPDLLQYTYKVASCVGIVSVALFGASKAARDYSISLGHSLQLTNILRDVGEDWEKEQRIYLPQDLIDKHGYSEDKVKNNTYNEAFISMMHELTQKAEEYYAETAKLYSHLSKADKKALAPMETMMRIYKNILRDMKADHFQVYAKRYKISDLKKVYHLGVSWLAARL